LEDQRIILSGMWVSTMLIYLLGDVIRIFAGDFTSGVMDGTQVPQDMWVIAAAMMLIPILMVVSSLALGYKVDRVLNIGIAALFFVFNIYGLPGYPGLYDRFLLSVSLGFNLVTIWYAWKWRPTS
jgi:hypothetical protein